MADLKKKSIFANIHDLVGDSSSLLDLRLRVRPPNCLSLVHQPTPLFPTSHPMVPKSDDSTLFSSSFPSCWLPSVVPYPPSLLFSDGHRTPVISSRRSLPSLKSPPDPPTSKQNLAPPPRFQCPDCNRNYSTFSGLSKHRQFHCASQLRRHFDCKYCPKEYSSLGALKMHIRTHTLPCKCQLCGKAFSRPWLLQGHLRTHTGEKPFCCAYCQRAFADRSNLRAHLQTHSEVKKYRCLRCHKTFSRMSLLTKHEKGACSGLLIG